MNNLFNSIRVKNHKYNLFNLSHEVKQTQDFGQLIPSWTEIIYPNDKFKCRLDLLVKSLPMVAPLMHRIDVYAHYFYVPFRLIFGGWDEFITGYNQKTAKALDTLPQVPKYLLTGSASGMQKFCGAGSLLNYLGFPPFNYQEYGNQGLQINIPKYIINAYLKIYNDYYRDQNLDPEIPLDLTSTNTTIPVDDVSGDLPNPFRILDRCWRKDYFTSVLPDAQQGQAVNVLPTDQVIQIGVQSPSYPFTISAGSVEGSDILLTKAGGTGASTRAGLKTSNGQSLTLDSDAFTGSIKGGNVTINSLRQQVRLQTWLEKMERSGHRYVEQLWSMFNSRSDDARLQRAEFLGGGRQPVVITEIQNQTYTNSSGAPLGKQGGNSLSVGSQSGFKRRFKEHGILMCITSLVPAAGYFQGYPRKFNFSTRNEMYWPEFAHLGEQEVRNGEIFYNFSSAASGVNAAEFGYQSRYAELKHNQDRVAGLFAKTTETSLFYWHLARYFKPQGNNTIGVNTTVNLNSDFMHIDKDALHRCFAVISDQPSSSPFYVQMYHDVRAARKMPKFGTPTL